MISFEEIGRLAKRNFSGKIVSVRQINKATTRIEFTDKSFLDIFQSIKDPAKFAYHLQLANGIIFRLDCRPERKYKRLKTFPWHFHKKTEENVVVSPFLKDNKTALLEFFEFAKKELVSNKN